MLKLRLPSAEGASIARTAPEDEARLRREEHISASLRLCVSA